MWPLTRARFIPACMVPDIVLRSSNLKEWEHVYTTTGPPANGSAVEGKLLALPNRLILYYLYMHRPGEMEPSLPLPKPDVRNYVETRAVYTEDGFKLVQVATCVQTAEQLLEAQSTQWRDLHGQ